MYNTIVIKRQQLLHLAYICKTIDPLQGKTFVLEKGNKGHFRTLFAYVHMVPNTEILLNKSR